MRMQTSWRVNATAWLAGALSAWLVGACAHAAAPPRPRLDILGDPLPPGAVARIGTIRLRTAERCWGVAVTPDGKAILSRAPGELTFWDIETGKPIRKLRMGASSYPPPFSRDGKILLGSRGRDGLLTLNLPTGRDLQFFDRPDDIPRSKALKCLTLAPDGKTVAMGWADKTVRLFDVGTGKQRLTIRGLRHPAQSLLFTPNCLSVVAGEAADQDEYVGYSEEDLPHSVLVWDVRTGKLQHRLRGFVRRISAMSCSPDSRFLATEFLRSTQRTEEGHLRVWDLATGKLERRLSDPRITTYAPYFSPDGRTLAICDGRLVHFLDWPGGKILRTLEGFSRTPVAFTPDSRTLVGVGEDERSISLWDIATGRKRLVPHGDGGTVAWPTMSPDGRTVAGGCPDLTVRLWDAGTGKVLRELDTYSGALSGMTFSPDGLLLAWTAQTPRHVRDASTTLAVCNVSAGRVTTCTFPGWQSHPSFSADGRQVVVGGGDRLRFWDVEKGKEVPLLPGEPEAQGAVFAPDGKTLAVVTHPGGRGPGEIQLWDLTAGKVRLTLTRAAPAGGPSLVQQRMDLGRGGWMSSAAVHFCPQQPLVVAGDSTGRVHIWDAMTGALRRVWQAHRRDPSYALAVSLDGKLVATASNWRDRGVHIWEVATGKEVLHLPTPSDELDRLRFLPDGRRLLTGETRDGTALIWDLVAAPSDDIEPGGGEMSFREGETLWHTLAEPGAAGFRAVVRLARAPGQAMTLLRAKLRPATAADARTVQRLIQGLDANAQADRDIATRALEAFGELVAPALRQALVEKPSAEAKKRIERLLTLTGSPDLPAEHLRQCRAVQALEWMGGSEARRLLRLLAGGEPLAALTRDARAALKRLEGQGEQR